MKYIGFELLLYYSSAIGITVNYKSRGGEWAAPTLERPHLYMCRLPFQAQISVTSITQTYLCINITRLLPGNQSMLSIPLIL